MFAKPTFEEIETGNVIAAEKLSVFKKDDKVQTDETQSENENNTPISTKRYYSYEIIRLSIPASLEQSVMSYRDQFGQTQTINADRYGYIREICAEEDSWGGQYSLFQRTQLGPCASDNTNNNNNTPLYGGGSGGGGRYDSGFIDYNRDQDFIARGERPNLQVQQ